MSGVDFPARTAGMEERRKRALEMAREARAKGLEDEAKSFEWVAMGWSELIARIEREAR